MIGEVRPINKEVPPVEDDPPGKIINAKNEIENAAADLRRINESFNDNERIADD